MALPDAITAQRRTPCPGCLDTIEPGQQIVRRNDRWQHEECAERDVAVAEMVERRRARDAA